MSNNIVKHIRRFVSLNDEEAVILMDHLRPLSVKKKEDLLREGQVCRSHYFVEKGCMRMFFINEKGIEQITQFAIETWWLTDHVSFASQMPGGFNIQTIEACELYAIDFEIQEKLYTALPQLERYFRFIYQRSAGASQMRMKYLYGFSREQMYRHFSSLYPEFVQRIPQYMLASYLGFTPEYMSEIRKKTNLDG